MGLSLQCGGTDAMRLSGWTWPVRGPPGRLGVRVGGAPATFARRPCSRRCASSTRARLSRLSRRSRNRRIATSSPVLTALSPSRWSRSSRLRRARLSWDAGDAGLASRITSVPAARSPSRWLRCEEDRYQPRQVARRAAVDHSQQVADRAGGEVHGSAASRTTRRWVSRLPGVRPAASTSKDTLYP